MPQSALRIHRTSSSRRFDDEARVAALALGCTAALAGVSLLVFFVVGGPLGWVNDLANAAVGWLTLALALLVRAADGREGWPGVFEVMAAGLGALGMTWGTYLVLSETTGFYLAGLYSSLGTAALGSWLLLARRRTGDPGILAHAPVRLSRVLGAVMGAGALALPGLLDGVDAIGDAKWHTHLSSLSWFGLYVLYPVWCLRLARRLRPGGSS